LPARLQHELLTGAIALAFDDTFRMMVAAAIVRAICAATLCGVAG
jgi:hypothetical protein